jgi:hypothetical protein
MPSPRRLLSTLAFVAIASAAGAQDLPLPRRFFLSAPSVTSKASQVPAAAVPGADGTVLVVYRVSLAGAVMDAKISGGNPAMRQSAEASIRQWKFKPFSVAGVPAQLFSAVNFAFSNGTATVQPAPPMSASDLSPRLHFACPNAIQHPLATAPDACKSQLAGIVKDKQSTPMERITALNEYGLALLEVAHKPDQALKQFDAAINLLTTAGVLQPSDAEWGYALLYRATAETQLGNQAASQQDFAKAHQTFTAAEAAATGPVADFYHRLAAQTEPATLQK